MSNLPVPSFSVVIPLFNKQQSVARCLSSVLKQSRPAAEIIIVNDGSTDQSLAVVQKITDARIHLFNQANGGVSSARNYGFSRAQNEFIALLDADDEWDAGFLEKMAGLIQKFSEAGLYYAAHLNVNGEKMCSTVIPSLPVGSAEWINIFDLDTDQGPCSSAVVIRKSFLEKTGLFHPRLIKGEDVDLWIRFALNGPIALYNAPLSICHRDHANSAMIKPCPPERSLISNLYQYETEARKNPSFHKYLERMRVGHISNFLGGNPCELADPHREIDNLDLSLLSPVWTAIRHSPRSLRRLVFQSYVHGNGIIRRLGRMARR